MPIRPVPPFYLAQSAVLFQNLRKATSKAMPSRVAALLTCASALACIALLGVAVRRAPVALAQQEPQIEYSRDPSLASETGGTSIEISPRMVSTE